MPPSPLRLRRLTLGLKQADVAEISGLSREQVTRLELGLCSPTRRTVRDLAHALECDPELIFPDNDESPAGETGPSENSAVAGPTRGS